MWNSTKTTPAGLVRVRYRPGLAGCGPPESKEEAECGGIKMIGRHSSLRDVMGRSYPIYACNSNHARYSSVHVTFYDGSKRSLLKEYYGKNLTGRKCQAYRKISYKIFGNVSLFKRLKTTWT